ATDTRGTCRKDVSHRGARASTRGSAERTDRSGEVASTAGQCPVRRRAASHPGRHASTAGGPGRAARGRVEGQPGRGGPPDRGGGSESPAQRAGGRDTAGGGAGRGTTTGPGGTCCRHVPRGGDHTSAGRSPEGSGRGGNTAPAVGRCPVRGRATPHA